MICKRRKGNCSSTWKLCVVIFEGLIKPFTVLRDRESTNVSPFLEAKNNLRRVSKRGI